ncbi:MAG: hypothetical protein ACRDF4_06930 [Rhabdochlamydiaceae bacterium]
MTFAYQPSAAGISWLTLAQTLDSRTEMEKDLLALSAENSEVQINMTQTSADQTFNELTAQANGQEQNAIFTMTGGAAGIVASVASLAGSIATRPVGENSTIKSTVGVEQVEDKSSTLNAPKPLETQPSGSARVTAQNEPSSASPAKATPAADKSSSNPRSTPLHEYLVNHGMLLSQSLSSAIKSFGDMQQAKYTMDQAAAKRLEVLAQGLSTVMNAQGQMLSSAVGSADTYFNNLESAFTTIIQVSAVRA